MSNIEVFCTFVYIYIYITPVYIKRVS